MSIIGNDKPEYGKVPVEFQDMLGMFRAAARKAPDKQAIIYFDGSLTYAELNSSSDKLAAWLLVRGVCRGDRISIVLQNMPQFVIATVAAWKIGAIPVPGNPMYRRMEMAQIFGDCAPKVVICQNEIGQEMQAALDLCASDATVVVTSSHSFQTRNDRRIFSSQEPSSGDFQTLEAILTSVPVSDVPHIDVDGSDLGLILYTSGTTGKPKGVMLRHSSMAFNAEYFRRHIDLDDRGRIMGIAPLFHITGMNCHLGIALSAACTLILPYRVEPSLIVDLIKEHRPTYMIGAITAFNAMMGVTGVTAESFASLTRVDSGGAPIPPALHKALETTLGLHIHPAYGMSETASQTHLTPFMADIPVDPSSGTLAIGKPQPYTLARIVSDDGGVLGPNEVGELMIAGPQVMSGYWGKPDETAATIENGWLHTGDVAFYDDAGWYYLVDRMKDMIVASGFKVWPREVEDALYTHPAVREAAVIGVPDDYRGETVKAFVSLKAGTKAEPSELIAHCRDILAVYKAPRMVDVLPDLPKTITGKIQRMALRDKS